MINGINLAEVTGRELKERSLTRPSTRFNLSGSLETAGDSVASNLIGQRDARIIDAVSERLGSDQWRVCDIQKRLVFQHAVDGVTTVLLDDEPLLQFDPPEFGTKVQGEATYLTATQKFRKALIES